MVIFASGAGYSRYVTAPGAQRLKVSAFFEKHDFAQENLDFR